jgi:hypothetical protein
MVFAVDQADENVKPVALEGQERIGLRFGHTNYILNNIYMRQVPGGSPPVRGRSSNTVTRDGPFGFVFSSCYTAAACPLVFCQSGSDPTSVACG